MREIIKKVSFLKNFDDKTLEKVSQRFIKRCYSKDSVIVAQDEIGEFLYIILKGCVKVCLLGEDGKEVILSILKESDFFGEMSVIDRQPRSASVIALEDCELLVIHRRDFLEILKEYPEISLEILSVLTQRLRKADAQIETLALMDVYGRVARYLLEVAKSQGKETPEGVVILSPPKQAEIASQIGTTRETVSRVMTDLQRRGYIIFEPGKKIVIKERLPDSRPED